MRPNRRDAISLLAGAAPTALGALSAASAINRLHAELKPSDRNPVHEVDTRIGTLQFTHDFPDGYPTDATIEKLYDERDFQRACQAYLWSLPAVSFASWQRGITQQLGAKNGQIVAKVAQRLSPKGHKLYLTTTHYHAEHAAGDGGFPPDTVVIRALRPCLRCASPRSFPSNCWSRSTRPAQCFAI